MSSPIRYVQFRKSGADPGMVYKVECDSSITHHGVEVLFLKNHPEMDREGLLRKLREMPVEQFMQLSRLVERELELFERFK